MAKNNAAGMGSGMGLALQHKQEMTMTAELRQAIELLQLNGAELLDMVERELGENPCLEKEEQGSEAARNQEEERAEGEWGEVDIRDEGDWAIGNGQWAMGEDGEGWEARASKAESLQDFLWRKYAEVVTEAKLRAVGRVLIDGVDGDGYLRADVLEAAVRMGVPEGLVDDARAILQTCEPAGVGARDLAECLRLQLHAKGQLDAVAEVCVGRLDLVAAGKWEELAGVVNKETRNQKTETRWEPCDAEEVRLAVAEIKKCNPKPALALGRAEVEAVVPEVIVSRMAGLEGWRVELNGAVFPKLMAVPLGGDRNEERGTRNEGAERARRAAQAYAGERLGRAKWLISALEQRAKTTLAVAKAIVQAQRQFLEAGKEFLLPLTLKQVADAVGVHESTVSRVVTGKYMLTPWGTVAFKAFFASGVASTGGNVGVASSSVQVLISRLVKGEDAGRPLSDEQIVAKLKDEGVAVARRTVAKYRGILGIPGTAERRVRAG